MCAQHSRMMWRRRGRDKFWRMPLIEGGFVGCYNKYGYGALVTDERVIDWDTVERLTVPRYWYHSPPEQSARPTYRRKKDTVLPERGNTACGK